jgi:hypothetical protein
VQQNQIELVVLTGGPTETPLVKALIARTFPAATLSEENKLSSAALGLGYDAQRRRCRIHIAHKRRRASVAIGCLPYRTPSCDESKRGSEAGLPERAMGMSDGL